MDHRHHASPITPRFDAVDALRGFAMLWMTVFHFCFDLNFFGFWRQDFYSDPFWVLQRTAIVGLFLFCGGMGQAIAVAQGQPWRRFWRRWSHVFVCALLVTVGSWLLYPDRFIYFGVLHGMALMLLMTRLLLHGRINMWRVGAGVMLAYAVLIHVLGAVPMPALTEALNSRSLNWLGLITRKPLTEDYVPLLPWLGVMLWGAGAGAWLFRSDRGLWWTLPAALQPLARLGRWSLTYYMLHQPVMLGALFLVGWLVTR